MLWNTNSDSKKKKKKTAVAAQYNISFISATSHLVTFYFLLTVFDTLHILLLSYILLLVHATAATMSIQSLTHPSTRTHPSTTSNIFTKIGPIELKLCECTLVDILITIEVFFLYKVVRKMRSKKGHCYTG
jgi:hypothetical protein